MAALGAAAVKRSVRMFELLTKTPFPTFNLHNMTNICLVKWISWWVSTMGWRVGHLRQCHCRPMRNTANPSLEGVEWIDWGNRRNNRRHWGGCCFSWPTAFDRLVQSGNQMVFLEQSSNFSVHGDCASINSPPLLPFLKPKFSISLGHCRQLFFSRTRLTLQKRLDSSEGCRDRGLHCRQYGYAVIWLAERNTSGENRLTNNLRSNILIIRYSEC